MIEIIVVIVFLSLLVITGIFVIRNLTKKQEKAEDIVVGYLGYLNKLSQIIELSDKKLKQIDKKGAFESDDEVGYFFKTIKELQGILNEFQVEKFNTTPKE